MSKDIESSRESVASKNPYVRALLAERAGYVRAGKTDRVSQVDEQLEQRGYPTGGLPTSEGEPESRSAAPRGRRAPSTTTAEGDTA